MKILITGADGQLGKAFKNLLKKEEIPFVETDINTLDITNLEQTRSFITTKNKDVTHIINCAAYNAVDKAETDWKKAFAVNGVGVRNLALCANDINAELIHFSTNYVFSGKKEHYTIFDEPDPINKYGESKALGEKLLRIAKKYYLIRTSWVFGDGEQNFISKVLIWSHNNDVLRIVDDEISSPTYTIDLAKATCELIKLKAFGIYHITNTPCSRYDWAEFVLNEIGWKGVLKRAKQIDFDLPVKRPKKAILDNFGFFETTHIKLSNWKEATKIFITFRTDSL